MGRLSNKRLCFSTFAAAFGAVVVAESESPARAQGVANAWDGCYAGAQAGVAESRSRWAYTNSNAYSATGNFDPQQVPGVNFSQQRGLAGAQIGCNRAISDRWVAGLEGSFISNPMNRERNNNFIPFPQQPDFNYREMVTTKIQSIYSLTGRLGVAASPDWLFYGRAGFAVARIETAGRVSPVFFPAIFDFGTRAWHSGFVAGAGAEYRLFRNVTIGAEYNYYTFGKVTHSGAITAQDFVNGVASPASPVNHRVNADVQTFMARVNFGLDSSPFAAYTPAPSAPAGQFAAFTSNEVRYSSWTGNRGTNVFAPERGSGYQVYSPTTIGIDYLLPSQYKFETRLKGGYVYSSHNTPFQVARYEGPVDTQASFNLTMLNFDNIRPLLGVALNLPTGNSYLPGNQRFSRMDPDLVDVGSYGAGFNINPTAGFIVGLNETTALSLSAGYAVQGAFIKEGISLARSPALDEVNQFDLRTRVNPGDSFTANGNISSSIGSLVLTASVAYMAETRVAINGVAGGRSGDRLSSNGTANYQIDDRWALSLNISWNFAEKNKITGAFGNLITEPRNSNSNAYIGSFEPTYRATDRLLLGVNYSFLYRDANFYDQIQDQFSPAKQKHSVGASATYALTQAANMTFRGSHSWVRQQDSAFLQVTQTPVAFAFQPPALRYEAWAASVAANMNF